MLKDLTERIKEINTAADRWDVRVAQAGDQHKAETAGKLLDAAQRDYIRDDLWRDLMTRKVVKFEQPEDALEFISDQLHYCVLKIQEEWQHFPGRARQKNNFTRAKETQWILREISDGLAALIDGMAKQ